LTSNFNSILLSSFKSNAALTYAPVLPFLPLELCVKTISNGTRFGPLYSSSLSSSSLSPSDFSSSYLSFSNKFKSSLCF
jgi:hypothetical protein